MPVTEINEYFADHVEQHVHHVDGHYAAELLTVLL